MNMLNKLQLFLLMMIKVIAIYLFFGIVIVLGSYIHAGWWLLVPCVMIWYSMWRVNK